MKIIKAILRYCAYLINDIFTNKQLQKNKNQAYLQNGKDIKNAKKTGKYINGKKNYRVHLSALNKKTEKISSRNEKLIEDIFD